MCHIFLLNVEFSNACRFRGFQCHFLTVSRILFPRFHSPQVDTDEQSRLLDVARIVTKHSKGCDKFCVLTMSLYAFILLLYKQLLQYTLLKSFTVPSALLTKFPKKVPYETFTKLSTNTLLM